MKNITRSLLVPTLAIALPCFAFAQSGTSSSSASSQRDATGASSSYSAGADAKVGMQRVSEEQLENQLTAKALIGTDVHSASGEKIGEVVDVVLAPSLSAHAASASAAAGSASTYPSTGVTGSTNRSVTAGAPDHSDDKSSMAGIQRMQPAVIVSTGGMMGVGNDLVRVPISRISYNADDKEIRLNVSETEWKALRDTRATGGVTSTR
jgi:hypothetical protein